MATQREELLTETGPDSSGRILLDDRMVRLIGIPFFGIVIPNATRLINPDALSPLSTIIDYAYFILIAGIIWEGNRWLLFRYYPVIFNSRSLIYKYILMIGLNVFFSAPVSLIMLRGWKWISPSHQIPGIVIIHAVLLITVCVVFITNIYEKVLFTRHSEIEKAKMDQLERAKVQAELEALKNQIDPHFMFNTLNSISFLIEYDPEKAQQFIENLAEVYRYILQSKEKDLVFLKDEIDFMQSYAGLMELRYGKGFRLNMRLESHAGHRYLIPPVSMMVALENAVKHNEVSQKHPLTVEVEHNGASITIRNIITRRKKAKLSTRLGLKNLNQRFEKTLGYGIVVRSGKRQFSLLLPLLKLNQG